ncbi:MAG: multicopper oxidase family protein [Actinomycetota bacterium]
MKIKASCEPASPGRLKAYQGGRRWVTSGAGIVCVLAFVAFAATSCGSKPAASSAAPPTTAQQEAGMARGQPFQNPADLNTDTPPVLNLQLVAKPTEFDIGGKKVSGNSYDGDYVGPTLHMAPGEQVNLHLVNDMATATNLHFHGLHVTPDGNSDDVYISVPAGQSYDYQLNIPKDQPVGTYWYHDHDMCSGMGSESMIMPGVTPSPASSPAASPSVTPSVSTSPYSDSTASVCADVESQIISGLSGAIVIGDDRSLLPTGLQNVTAQTIVLKDMQIETGGHIIQNSNAVGIDSNAPTVRLVNGQLKPELTMQPGQTELWRLVNAGADIFYNLQLDGYTFTVVGQDGDPVADVTTASSLLLPPGKRYDVLVTAGSVPGDAWLRTLPYTNGPQGDNYPNVELMQLKVAGAAQQALPMPTGALAGSGTDLASASIAQRRTLTFSESSDGVKMFINNKQFDPNTSIFSTPAVEGTVEEWTIDNSSGETHPFHLHTDHFQVMSVNGVTQPFVGDQDTVPLPHEENGVPGQVVIRIDFTDFTGKVMFHCHIAAHEDAGMMSFVNVVAPSKSS